MVRGRETMNRAKKSTRIRQRWADNVFDICATGLLVVAFALVAYPLIYVVSASFSSVNAVLSGQVVFFPKELSLKAYETVFSNQSIMVGYRNSLIYMALGTGLNIVMTMLCAFCLSRKDFYGRGIVGGLLLFTMFFNGGLIPNYLLMMELKLLNTIWVMVLPGAMSAWYVMLTRSFLQSSIPEDLYESASLDGCSVFGMLLRITLPLSGPIIAVIGLYCAVGIWNSYFDAFIYLTKKELYPLQIALRNILIMNSVDASTMRDVRDLALRKGMINLLKYAVIVVASAPLLVMYPFVQKFFVKGIMIGSVKG